ncbi:hypothetical protein [Paenibacillus sp. USHLN196]|uniref:hypothetical protein n=1 Tax=Paenibacillus sp. USHLN196 TaxID=3081291 RepID=UPI003019FE32
MSTINFEIRSIMIQDRNIVDDNIKVYDCIIHLKDGTRARALIQDEDHSAFFRKFDIITAPCPYCAKRPLCDCNFKYFKSFEKQVNRQYGLLQLEIFEFVGHNDISEYWTESRVRFLPPSH